MSMSGGDPRTRDEHKASRRKSVIAQHACIRKMEHVSADTAHWKALSPHFLTFIGY